MLNSKFLINSQLSITNPAHLNQQVDSFYFRELVLRGVGFKFALLKDFLFARLGFSHYLCIKIPQGLTVKIRKDRLVVFGSNLNKVTIFAKFITDLRPPDSYKFKGVSYANQPVKVKIGKQR